MWSFTNIVHFSLSSLTLLDLSTVNLSLCPPETLMKWSLRSSSEPTWRESSTKTMTSLPPRPENYKDGCHRPELRTNTVRSRHAFLDVNDCTMFTVAPLSGPCCYCNVLCSLWGVLVETQSVTSAAFSRAVTPNSAAFKISQSQDLRHSEPDETWTFLDS